MLFFYRLTTHFFTIFNYLIVKNDNLFIKKGCIYIYSCVIIKSKVRKDLTNKRKKDNKMKRYVKRFLQEKGIIVAGNLDALDKVDNLTARKIKKDLVGLDFINAPHGRITNYLDHVLAYANAL